MTNDKNDDGGNLWPAVMTRVDIEELRERLTRLPRGNWYQQYQQTPCSPDDN